MHVSVIISSNYTGSNLAHYWISKRWMYDKRVITTSEGAEYSTKWLLLCNTACHSSLSIVILNNTPCPFPNPSCIHRNMKVVMKDAATGTTWATKGTAEIAEWWGWKEPEKLLVWPSGFAFKSLGPGKQSDPSKVTKVNAISDVSMQDSWLH